MELVWFETFLLGWYFISRCFGERKTFCCTFNTWNDCVLERLHPGIMGYFDDCWYVCCDCKWSYFFCVSCDSTVAFSSPPSLCLIYKDNSVCLLFVRTVIKVTAASSSDQLVVLEKLLTLILMKRPVRFFQTSQQ